MLKISFSLPLTVFDKAFSINNGHTYKSPAIVDETSTVFFPCWISVSKFFVLSFLLERDSRKPA